MVILLGQDFLFLFLAQSEITVVTLVTKYGYTSRTGFLFLFLAQFETTTEVALVKNMVKSFHHDSDSNGYTFSDMRIYLFGRDIRHVTYNVTYDM